MQGFGASARSAPGAERATSVERRRGMTQPGGRKAADRAAGLRGAKLPTWACFKCERTANWACRVVCQWGAKAPADMATR